MFDYGSAGLAALSRLPSPRSRVGPKALLAVGAKLPLVTRALIDMPALPVVEVRLSKAANERWRRCMWPDEESRFFRGLWAQAVLPLSREPDYLRGHARQAVRTNIRRATERGITARQVEHDEYVEAASHVYAKRSGGQAALSAVAAPDADEPFLWYRADSSDGRALAIAAVTMVGDFALLVLMVSDPTCTSSSYARYLLHTHVVHDLALRGVGFLAVGPVRENAEGLRYFQRLLGYVPCNLRPIVDGATRRRHRLLMRGPVRQSALPK